MSTKAHSECKISPHCRASSLLLHTLTELVIWAERWKPVTRCCEPVKLKKKKKVFKFSKCFNACWNVYNSKKWLAAYSSLRQQVVGTPSKHKHLPVRTGARCVPQPTVSRTQMSGHPTESFSWNIFYKPTNISAHSKMRELPWSLCVTVFERLPFIFAHVVQPSIT